MPAPIGFAAIIIRPVRRRYVMPPCSAYYYSSLFTPLFDIVTLRLPPYARDTDKRTYLRHDKIFDKLALLRRYAMPD